LMLLAAQSPITRIQSLANFFLCIFDSRLSDCFLFIIADSLSFLNGRIFWS
jgi:hypothetical protein